MELIYITQHSILDLHAIPPLFSWVIVIGAVYGAWRLVIDVSRQLGIPVFQRDESGSEEADPRYSDKPK